MDGQDRERVSNGDRDRFPDWSPDGERIVLERNDADLVVLSLADDTETTIGKGTQPSWSPAGNRVAFTVYEGESDRNPKGFGLWMSHSDGTDRRRLASSIGGRAVWSPDGSHVAFADTDDSTLEGTVHV